MTKEEAIDILKHPNEMYQGTDGVVGYTFNPNRKNYEAFQLAIKALEQEPCEDAVSRKFMYELGATCIATRDKNDKLIALGAIENLPSVTPTRKKAKWVVVTDGQFKFKTCIVCSNCNYEELGIIGSERKFVDDYLNDIREQCNYCPNCGADMESREDNCLD